jgi:type IV pilus assembly protein PilM
MAAPQSGVWGIDLGQCALKAIRLELVDGQVTATAFDYIEHPKILSQPDADPDQLTREALEQFLSRNTHKGDTVVISVPGQSGLARFVKLPPVEEKKIADIVRFEAKQQIPFPLEEVVWDFQKIGSGVVTDGFALETEIGLFAMKRDMVSRYMQHFQDVNVEVHIVQMAPLGLCNFVAYDLLNKGAEREEEEESDDDKKPCVVALDIGTDNSNLVITDGEKIIWQRPIPLGGNHFTRALTKDLKLTFAKAEHLKRNAVKSPDLKKILGALKPVLNDFVAEVQRSLGYFTNTHRDAQIQYMVGLGNAFRLPGLQKYMQEKLQLEVRKLSSLERLTGDDVVNAPQFTENVLSFAVAYGLALQGLKQTRLQTNLLPQEIQMERMIRAKKPWAAAAAAALLLAAAGLTFGRNLEYSAVENEEVRAALKAADAVVKQRQKLDSEYKAAEKQLEDSKIALKKLASGVEDRFNWQVLYQYINSALPRASGGSPQEAKVPTSTRVRYGAYERFVTEDARKAFKFLEEKRYQTSQAPGKAKDAREAAKEAADREEFIKQHLLQINIEGISSLYHEDLVGAGLYQYMKDTRPELPGLDPKERDAVKKPELKDQLIPAGWVFEIRGFTFHKHGASFIENTLLENLANPRGVNNKTPEEIYRDLSGRTIDKDGLGKMGYFLLLKSETVPDPEPGKFKIIRSSFLKTALRGASAGMFPGVPAVQADNPNPGADPSSGPAKKTRDGWRPIGDIAASVLGADPGIGPGPGGGQPIFRPEVPFMPQPGGGNPPDAKSLTNKQPRTEFVILFVWREAISTEVQAPVDPATQN